MYFTKVILTSFLIRGYKPHSTQSSLKRKGGLGGGVGGSGSLRQPTQHLVMQSSWMRQSSWIWEVGGGGGDGVGYTFSDSQPSTQGRQNFWVFLGGGGWQALSDNHLNTLVRPRLAAQCIRAPKGHLQYCFIAWVNIIINGRGDLLGH